MLCAQHHSLRTNSGGRLQSAIDQPQNCNNRRYDEYDYNGSFEHRASALLVVTDSAGQSSDQIKLIALRQASALFLIAPMIAVSMAPPAPPAISCETTPPTLRLPDSAAATTDGSANVTIWPSTPPPTKPETMLPIVPRSKFGDALPAPSPPSAPAIRFIRICTMLIPPFDPRAFISLRLST